MGQKQGFLNLLKNLVIKFCWICSMIKTYIICCVPAQLPCLGKFLFLRYGPKCYQPIRLQDIIINHISRKNQWSTLIFLHVDRSSHRVKVDQKDFWMGMIKNACGQSDHGTLKLTVSEEWIDRILVQIQES